MAAAEETFGTIDVIEHRTAEVPGSVEKVDFRAQDPEGPYGGVLLALRQGSYPVGPRQVAVTNGVAELLQLELGSTLALDGSRRTVVGIVENPRKLSDEFALVAPSSLATPDYATVLTDADERLIDSLFESHGERSAVVSGKRRGDDQPADTTFAMFSVATVFLLLASLVAAAGFAVVAQRRLRQLGMLTAVGATQKHVRLVLLCNGVVVGTIAAVVGTSVGLALWIAVRPDAGVGDRPSRRPAQPSLGTARGDRRSSQSSERPPPPGGPGERSPASRSCSRSRDDRPSRGPYATRPLRLQR